MTHKVFWEDPYRTSLATTVVAVSGADVTLAATIFFAFSGGQESDRGSIGGHEVVEARWEGGDLIYSLTPGHRLAPGDAVDIEIDAKRRSRLMRLHMATEIVLELLTQQDTNLVKVGAHIGAGRARIDFACDESLAPRLGPIESAANSMIADDLQITSAFSNRSAERRFWEIAGFARVPCSGTHPERTGEIGPVVLRRRNPGKGKERVAVTIADPVIAG